MKSLVIGASAGLGRALATKLAEIGHDLHLVASDARDLVPLSRDLHLRFGGHATFSALDLNDFDVSRLHDKVMDTLGAPTSLFYIAGWSTPEDTGSMEDVIASRLVRVNMLAAIKIVNAFLPDLEYVETGNIVGIGSTAAARPRRHNSVYGAAKRGIEFYFGTLRHYLAFRPCSVQFYRVGYLDTRLTAGMRLLFPKCRPSVAAEKIVKGLGKDRGVVYLPWWWRWIMLVYRSLPGLIHNRLDV